MDAACEGLGVFATRAGEGDLAGAGGSDFPFDDLGEGVLHQQVGGAVGGDDGGLAGAQVESGGGYAVGECDPARGQFVRRPIGVEQDKAGEAFALVFVPGDDFFRVVDGESFRGFVDGGFEDAFGEGEEFASAGVPPTVDEDDFALAHFVGEDDGLAGLRGGKGLGSVELDIAGEVSDVLAEDGVLLLVILPEEGVGAGEDVGVIEVFGEAVGEKVGAGEAAAEAEDFEAQEGGEVAGVKEVPVE